MNGSKSSLKLVVNECSDWRGSQVWSRVHKLKKKLKLSFTTNLELLIEPFQVYSDDLCEKALMEKVFSSNRAKDLIRCGTGAIM